MKLPEWLLLWAKMSPATNWATVCVGRTVVAALGEDVSGYELGDRVMVFHHIPCGECFYCQHKVFAQCPTYKKVGATAGYEPSGGGFAEYVRVMEWIVRKGVIRIPDGISFERASFIEPINTCM